MTYIEIYNIANNLIYVFIGLLFFSSFLTSRFTQVIQKSIVILSWELAVNAVSFLLDDDIVVKPMLAVLISALFILFYYKRQKYFLIVSLGLSVLFNALVFGCDTILIALQKIYNPTLSYPELVRNSYLIYIGVISQLVQFIIVLLLFKAFHKSRGTIVSWKEWISYSLFPAYSIVIVSILLRVYDSILIETQDKTFLYIAISFLILNLIVYFVIHMEITRQLNFQKNEMLVAHAEEIIALYGTISKERKELGKREHEYNNTINALANLYHSGEIEKLGELLRTCADQLFDSNVFETGNPIMSTLFNIKYAEAQKNGVRFQFVINDLSTLIVKDQDAIILISNILNNAIEAAIKCSENDRYIKMKAIIENKEFIFSVVNSSAQDPIISDGKLVSIKKDVIPHGYGIDRSIEIIESYNGVFDILVSENEFTFSVIIPQ